MPWNARPKEEGVGEARAEEVLREGKAYSIGIGGRQAAPAGPEEEEKGKEGNICKTRER